jgi:hypothetical protein
MKYINFKYVVTILKIMCIINKYGKEDRGAIEEVT